MSAGKKRAFAHSSSRGQEFLEEFVDCTSHVLVDLGIAEGDDAVAAARRIVERMRREWGGLQIYFPKGLTLEAAELDRQIYERFDGRNHRQLAKEFNVSTARIYMAIRIIKETGIPQQLPLDPDN